MKIFTDKQKLWLLSRKIEVNKSYSFPMGGFTVYEGPNFSSKSEFFSNSPFGKNLAHTSFLVKKIENGFCRGNFDTSPIRSDFYILEDELSGRTLLETAFLALISFLPCLVYNYFNKKKNKT